MPWESSLLQEPPDTWKVALHEKCMFKNNNRLFDTVLGGAFTTWQLWNAARLGIKWAWMLVAQHKAADIFLFVCLFARFWFASYDLQSSPSERIFHECWWFHLHNLLSTAWLDLRGIPRMHMLSFLFWSLNLAIGYMLLISYLKLQVAASWHC